MHKKNREGPRRGLETEKVLPSSQSFIFYSISIHLSVIMSGGDYLSTQSLNYLLVTMAITLSSSVLRSIVSGWSKSVMYRSVYV